MLWCKRLPVTDELLRGYKLQPAIEMTRRTSPVLAENSDLDVLTKAAECVGRLLQNRHKGFLRNKRQQRAAGEYIFFLLLATVELSGI